MPRPTPAVLLLATLFCATSALGQTPLAPEAGVLALRNGHVIHGYVTRAGDYYLVSNGEGSEIRLKTDDVESFCATLQETYEFKKRHLSGITARPHLDLARWCLRHELYDECREQLEAAERVEPSSNQVADLKRRLELALEVPLVPAPAVAAPQVPLESVENALAAVPKGSVEKFGAVVQPILLNRCAANQCHGPNSKSDFKLLRPPPGQTASRRFTQRNLYATLRYLNRAAPDASPLVILPQQPHGSSLTPVFDKHSLGQLAELLSWARLTAGPATAMSAPRPATIDPRPQALSQPVISAEATADQPIRVMRPAEPAAGESAIGPTPQPGTPRDHYDPAIFNQRYHAR